MDDTLPAILDLLTLDVLWPFVRALLLILIGFVVARLASAALVRAFRDTLDTHRRLLLQQGSFYLVLVPFLISALYELGFDLTVLLGAAGILTVAIGFASQTSMSNLISGLFLITEGTFKVDDIIQVEGTVGEVISIDLLSIKLRKFDNTYVRIPNEMLIKSQVMNFTKFPIRRIDLHISVARKEDIGRVRDLLYEVADNNPLCLEEPRPLFIFQGFSDSAWNLQFSVWAGRENFIGVKNSIQLEIKTAFEAAGIEIPFPHRTLFVKNVSDPLPVQLAAEAESSSEVD